MLAVDIGYSFSDIICTEINIAEKTIMLTTPLITQSLAMRELRVETLYVDSGIMRDNRVSYHRPYALLCFKTSRSIGY